jgi:hypothetical protein
MLLPFSERSLDFVVVGCTDSSLVYDGFGVRWPDGLFGQHKRIGMPADTRSNKDALAGFPLDE